MLSIQILPTCVSDIYGMNPSVKLLNGLVIAKEIPKLTNPDYSTI